MPLKSAKASKSSSPQPLASRDEANPAVSQASADDDTLLMWVKISNRILATIN